MDQFRLAREMLNSYGRKATPPRVCMSIDLRKAFNSISWAAIDTSLEAFGFSPELRFILQLHSLDAGPLHKGAGL